jgi:hypothetical protein
MSLLQTKIQRALVFVQVAIEHPQDEPLRAANQHAAEVLDELGYDLEPEERGEVAQLTHALHRLRRVLSAQPLQPF